MSTVKKIEHYQRNIEKYGDNETRMLHCLTKLSSLPVTVQHLQKTGVGRTVNALRKYRNGIGDAAKTLVAKWKAMVVNDDSSEDEEDGYVIDTPADSPNCQDSSSLEQVVSSQKSEKNGSLSHTNKHCSKLESRLAASEAQNNEKDNPKDSTINDLDKYKKLYRSKENEKCEVKKEKACLSNLHCSTSASNKGNCDYTRESRNNVSGGEKGLKTPDNDKELKGSKSLDKKRKRDSVNVSRTETKKIKNLESEHEKSNHNLSCRSEKSNVTSSTHNTKERAGIKEPQDEEGKDLKNSSEKTKSGTSEHKSNNRNKSHNYEEKHKYKDQAQSSHKKNSKHENKYHYKKESSLTKSSSSSNKYKRIEDKLEIIAKESGNDSKHNDAKEVTKIKQEFNSDDGIDCNSGASFAEALGMCTMTHATKKRKDIGPSANATKSSRAEQKFVPGVKTSPSVKSEPQSNDHLQPPSLLSSSAKLEPLRVDLASTLPEISPNYKPLPHINTVQRKEEDKMLTNVIYVKNQRTKVYSGNKTGYTTVPSLFELCIRVLIENIDALEFTGGVPYDIIKPVLERATPDQLFMLEHYNPYLIGDTDGLWQFHCNREFRNKQREEMESWREMYMRCLNEREEKLKTLTANIKQSIDKSVPVRSTKLAYVDNIVKPPRNILKKQAKYGTANAVPKSTSMLKKKLTAGAGQATETDILLQPAPTSRLRTATGIVKKAKAPLMAKALQLIKGRYKR